MTGRAGTDGAGWGITEIQISHLTPEKSQTLIQRKRERSKDPWENITFPHLRVRKAFLHKAKSEATKKNVVQSNCLGGLFSFRMEEVTGEHHCHHDMNKPSESSLWGPWGAEVEDSLVNPADKTAFGRAAKLGTENDSRFNKF